MASDLGLNPSMSGDLIRLTMPASQKKPVKSTSNKQEMKLKIQEFL